MNVDLSPLAVVVLLVYGLLIAASLTVWATLTLTRRRVGDGEERRSRPRVQVPSNDEVRGARAVPAPPTPAKEGRRGEDAFERFLHSSHEDRNR